MELRCAVSVLLALLGYFRVQAILWPDQNPLEEHLATEISATLQKIFTNSFALNNFSVFISTAYEKMDRDRVNLVHLVLDRSLMRPNCPVPVVLDSRMNRKIVTQFGNQLLFVQNAEQAKALANGLEKNHLCIVVLLSFLSDSEQRSIMSTIFAYFLQERYNINVVILVPSLQGVRGFNVLPYTAESCKSTEPVEIDLKDSHIRDLYPERLKNLHGCPLSVIVWDIPPYMTVHWERSDPLTMLEGLDGRLLRILARKMNFTLKLIPNEPAGLIGGSSYMNGTFTGAYKMLRERRANMTIGCAACTTERSAYLAVTVPYSQLSYILVMPARGGYSIYEVMLFPFKGYTWLFLGSVLCLHRILRRCWLVPAPVIAGWMLWIFVIRASYEASVFNFIHNSPVKPSPRTFENTLSGGYRFITDHATYRMTLKLPAFEGKTAISPGQPVDVFHALLKAPWKTGAFTSRSFLAEHLVKHRNHRNKLVILAEKIVDNMICMYFPYDSYFAWEISHLLFKMRSFGLFQHHSEILAWSSMPTTTDAPDPRSARYGQHEDAATGFAKSMGFVLAAFNCLMAALGVSILVFGLEHLSHTHRWPRLTWLMERI
ncbi:uncharacterized protein LOC128260767 [Drosophila gunungcola]|uniref:uncharacterized protein LOC128260767 n=1 Tax=Drosophila gunungcola TaxID=103775 RepID=UPI0022E5C88F|nr:uncharacterized protein LOC128260767 [Drosophila gunungcola]